MTIEIEVDTTPAYTDDDGLRHIAGTTVARSPRRLGIERRIQRFMYTSVATVPTLSAATDVMSGAIQGHPVIVMPGFMACDLSTTLLRSRLRRRGYDAITWGFGRNVGPVDGLLERML